MSNKPTKCTVIDGVKLTSNAIEELISLQEHNDEKLNLHINDLTNLVFQLIKYKEYLGEEGKNLDQYLGIIGFIRETFVNLRSDTSIKLQNGRS